MDESQRESKEMSNQAFGRQTQSNKDPAIAFFVCYFTYFPVEKKLKISSIFTALWIENIFGKNKDEIIGTFYKFLLSNETQNILLSIYQY